MAKKNKITLENISLKPQSLGKVYKKKNNIVRVIFIFISFLIIIYYINDISLFINKLLGKNSATTIIDNQEKNKEKKKKQEDYQEVIFYEYIDDLKIEYNNLKITNFRNDNKVFSFVINNITNNDLSLKDKKYYFEFYNENKTLLKRMKVDIDIIKGNSSINKSLELEEEIKYLTFSEKNEQYYPNITLDNNELTCLKDNDNIIYTFIDNKLSSIKHTIVNSKDSINYEENFNEIQEYVNKYNTYNGISGSLDNDDNGYNAIIMINLRNVVDEINKYYFKSDTLAKVVNFEMEAYGFDCN